MLTGGTEPEFIKGKLEFDDHRDLRDFHCARIFNSLACVKPGIAAQDKA